MTWTRSPVGEVALSPLRRLVSHEHAGAPQELTGALEEEATRQPMDPYRF